MKISTTRKYLFFIALIGIYFVVELVVSIIADSIALQTDALHMLSDLIALIIGYSSTRLTERQRSDRYTYGWIRAEIIGGLINSVFLLAISFSLLIEIIHKLTDLAEDPHNQKLEDNIDVVLISAGIGLFVNLIGIALFAKEHTHHHHHDEDPKLDVNRLYNDEDSNSNSNSELFDEITEAEIKATVNYNHYAVLLHIIGDTLASVAVIISSLLIKYATQPWRFYADPIASFLIILFIGYSSAKLLKNTSKILLHKSHKIDHPKLLEKIKAFPEVDTVHEFHIWPLTTEINIASLHVKLHSSTSTQTDQIITKIKQLLHQNHIHSSTIQPEWDDTCLEPQCRDNCPKLQCCPEEV